MYRAAHEDGADVVHRASFEGTEDFLIFERPPRTPWVTYRVALHEVAGLPLVANTLELLDATGTPRLRVAPPYLIDERGRHHTAALAVEGCSVDVDPAPPFRRPVVSPGATTCRLRITWDGAAVAYPAILDPSWTTTASLTEPRALHSGVSLPDGRVLVAGGINDFNQRLGYAEIFDADTETWSVTGSLNKPRTGHRMSHLVDGRVLVMGGSYISALSSCELYDPTTGVWTPTGDLTEARGSHTASVLDDGRVLVAGGSSDNAAVDTAEVFDPATGAWNATQDMGAIRRNHSASVRCRHRKVDAERDVNHRPPVPFGQPLARWPSARGGWHHPLRRRPRGDIGPHGAGRRRVHE